MEFFLKDDVFSSRKHAILTVFHAMELMLKERLAQTNPIPAMAGVRRRERRPPGRVWGDTSLSRMQTRLAGHRMA